MSDDFTLVSKSCLKFFFLDNSEVRTLPVSLVLLVPVLSIQSVIFLKIDEPVSRLIQVTMTLSDVTSSPKPGGGGGGTRRGLPGIS